MMRTLIAAVTLFIENNEFAPPKHLADTLFDLFLNVIVNKLL